MDLKLLQWINSNMHGCTFVNYTMKYITYLAEVAIAWLIIAIVLICFKKTRKSGLVLLLGIGVVALLGWVLKSIINRTRPFERDADLANFITSIKMSLPKTASCPSGHTIVSFGAATILTCQFKGKGAVSYVLATLIAFSRVFLCVHYLTDVLLGAVLGVVFALGWVVLFNFVLKKITSNKNKE